MKKKLLFLSGTLSAALFLGGCGASNGTIRIGAAGIGGTYQSVAASFVQLATDADFDQEFEVKTTAGSAANLRLLSQGYLQLAIAQTDMADNAYNGTGSFSDQSYQGYSAVAGLYTEACQIVVREDSDIESLDDLMNKKVSIGEEESGTEQNAVQILEAAGLSEKLVDEVNMNYTEAAKALNSSEIDAFFCTAGVQTTVIEELAQQCEIRLLAIDDSDRDKLDSLYGFYTDYTIPAGTYTGQEEDVQTVGIKSLLLASDKLSTDTVQSLTALLFEKQEDLQYSVPVDFELDEESAVSGITIPFHKGAASYYNIKGIQVETAND